MAYRSCGSMVRIAVIRSRDSTMHPSMALAPPDNPVPAPRGTTGTPSSFAHVSVVLTSSKQLARTRARALPAGTMSALSRLEPATMSGSVTSALGLSRVPSSWVPALMASTGFRRGLASHGTPSCPYPPWCHINEDSHQIARLSTVLYSAVDDL